MSRAPLSPASALIAHIEPLVDDRRILVIGNAERSVAEHLLDRGARLVQLLDPDPKRVTQAAANNSERLLSFAPLTKSSLRDGSYDVILVEDVTLADDLNDLVSGIARTMSNRSIAIFCASNPDATTGLLGVAPGATDYDDLADTCESNFEEVWMLGQAPFVGYSVVQLGLDHPPEPALDNAYLEGEGESPDFYMALCGSEETMAEVTLEDMTIVQLPAGRFVHDSQEIHREKERRASKRIDALEAQIAVLHRQGQDKKIDELTSELEKRDGWIRTLEARAESADTRADDVESEYDEIEKELELTHAALLKEQKKAASVETLEKQLATLKKDAEEHAHHAAGLEALEGELNLLDEKRKSLELELKEKRRAQEKLEKRVAEQQHELDELHDHLDESEERLKSLKQQLSENDDSTKEEVERDLRGLEDQLRKRGERVLELEGQLQKLEAFAKTLSVELKAPPSDDEVSQRQELEKMAKALAEREADLVAAQWTIGQLRQSSAKN